MSKFFLNISLILVFVFSTSCSKDSDDSIGDSVVGTWELTTWTIEVPIDLNNDTLSSNNLLDEASCDNNETLTFDVNGTVSSNMTYNPDVVISLTENSTEDYFFSVVCDTEGIIGTAGPYSQTNNSVTLFNKTATIYGNQLTIVYEDAINIYNADLTAVVTTRDLTLVYTRK